uniref:(northern house mosquito) hypothetical protein n=1 Tax=Culex pipiens TaxID=7175 RepID=A0A8D8FPI9_CULPI
MGKGEKKNTRERHSKSFVLLDLICLAKCCTFSVLFLSKKKSITQVKNNKINYSHKIANFQRTRKAPNNEFRLQIIFLQFFKINEIQKLTTQAQLPRRVAII